MLTTLQNKIRKISGTEIKGTKAQGQKRPMRKLQQGMHLGSCIGRCFLWFMGGFMAEGLVGNTMGLAFAMQDKKNSLLEKVILKADKEVTFFNVNNMCVATGNVRLYYGGYYGWGEVLKVFFKIHAQTKKKEVSHIQLYGTPTKPALLKSAAGVMRSDVVYYHVADEHMETKTYTVLTGKDMVLQAHGGVSYFVALKTGKALGNVRIQKPQEHLLCCADQVDIVFDEKQFQKNPGRSPSGRSHSGESDPWGSAVEPLHSKPPKPRQKGASDKPLATSDQLSHGYSLTLKTLHATGHVFFQKDEKKGRSDALYYDAPGEKVKFWGNVFLYQKDFLTGDQGMVDLKTKKACITGTTGKGVAIFFQPNRLRQREQKKVKP